MSILNSSNLFVNSNPENVLHLLVNFTKIHDCVKQNYIMNTKRFNPFILITFIRIVFNSRIVENVTWVLSSKKRQVYNLTIPVQVSIVKDYED